MAVEYEYIAIFDGNPTAGETDGSVVSQNQLMDNPAGGNIAINNTQGVVEKLAVRCDTGYHAVGGVTISCYRYIPEGTQYPQPSSPYLPDSSLISLSIDNVNFSQSITLQNVGDTNTIFYLKRVPSSIAGRVPLSLRVQCEVEGVE